MSAYVVCREISWNGSKVLLDDNIQSSRYNDIKIPLGCSLFGFGKFEKKSAKTIWKLTSEVQMPTSKRG